MSFFDTLFDLKQSDHIVGLTKELRAIYIWQKYINNHQPILVVENSLYEASSIYQTIMSYTDSVQLFPMDDFLTSEVLATSPELKTTRLETIMSIIQNPNQIVVTNMMGFLRFLPTKKMFQTLSLTIKKGNDYSIHDLIQQFYQLGYQHEITVNMTGSMAVRGFVVDIFPLGAAHPVRFEFWGDTIDSIRVFDIDSQLTVKEIDSITIPPNSEFLVASEITEEDQSNLKQRDIPKYGSVASIQDFLNDPIIAYTDYSSLLVSYENLVQEMFEHSVNIEIDPKTKYMHSFHHLAFQNQLFFDSFDDAMTKDRLTYRSTELEPFHGNYQSMNDRLNAYLISHDKVVICLSSRYQVNKVLEELQNPKLIFTSESELFDHRINLIVKKISKGFIINSFVVISENDLFARQTGTQTYKTNFKYGTKIKDITKLELGDYIVHSIHGIGRYCGIKTLPKNGLQKDYLQIEYKDHDKLYIPVEKIELITKFSSSDSAVPKINKLGSTEWEKTKLRAKKHAENIASELLVLYAERESKLGFSFLPDTEEQLEFERLFPYTETSDQIRVTDEIKKDMESARPMDRLLCGDVGYGKTEVAFRAMFKAVLSGKQVALLCPTTILSNQHYQNALERFSSFPINISIMNRFTSTKQLQTDLQRLKDGKIDIIIGTHRILSNDIIFHDLGLLVIDEEQRFGVKHKEKIKQYKNSVDVLTLSATPIPRTLQMSMAGLRSLSLIETPPVNRYPIQTYVLRESKEIIKDAIYKELSRDGQTFILYNYVEDMASKQREIEQLVKEARVISAHGQMPKKELEEVMQKFINHEYDVLLCTTIIETGIDIPSVNTLLIIDADRFGLSQLYQIRGRVGRSNKIAYCYLMYHAGKVLSEIATKRLKVIKDFTELGSGFAIAMRDLSIRGAGDILGSEQAGFIDSIGIELFLRMLQEEINRLKGIPVLEEEKTDTQPLLSVATAINDDYVADEELKIEIHKKINSIDSYDHLLEIKTELEDRFGKISSDLEVYMYQEWFQKLADQLGIKAVRQTKTFVEIELAESLTDNLDGEYLFTEINKISRMFRFSMRRKSLIITLDIVKLERHFVYYLVDLLNVIVNATKSETKKT